MLVGAGVFTVLALAGVAGLVLALRGGAAPVISPGQSPVPVAPAVSPEPSLTPQAPAPVPPPVPVAAPVPPPLSEGDTIDDLLNNALSNGTLLVNTVPRSTVYLGERELGTTPLRTGVPAGHHTLTLVYSHGERREVQVTVEAGRSVRISRRLRAGSADSTAGAAPADQGQAPTGRARPSRSDVVHAMQGVTPAVRRCANGATGVAPVRMVFESDGRVVQARVSGGPLPAATRSCVERAAMAARVPPPLRQPHVRRQLPLPAGPVIPDELQKTVESVLDRLGPDACIPTRGTGGSVRSSPEASARSSRAIRQSDARRPTASDGP